MEPGSGLPALSSKETVNGAAFEEKLEPLNGARIRGRFEDHEPAIVENSSGKGRGILIGSFLALAYHNQANEATKQLFLTLARSARVIPDFEVTGSGTASLEVRRLVNTHEEIVFTFNHSDAQVDATLSLSLPFEAQRAQNLKDDSPVSFSASGSRVMLHRTLNPGESWIVSIEGQHTE